MASVQVKIGFISMNLAARYCPFVLSQSTIKKLTSFVEKCDFVIVGVQESKTEQSFIPVLQRSVLSGFTRKYTKRQHIPSDDFSLSQMMWNGLTTVAEYATYMVRLYKTVRLYVFQKNPTSPQIRKQQLVQYKCMRQCGFSLWNESLWKGANILRMTINGQQIFVVNTHLFYSSEPRFPDHGLSVREEQFKKIIHVVLNKLFPQENALVVVMGDLNFRMVYPTFTPSSPPQTPTTVSSSLSSLSSSHQTQVLGFNDQQQQVLYKSQWKSDTPTKTFRSYQQFITSHAPTRTRHDDQLFISGHDDQLFISENVLTGPVTQQQKKVIQQLIQDIPEKPPLTCKMTSQSDDSGQQRLGFQQKFQIRTDKKKMTEPSSSKKREPSNCDKILKARLSSKPIQQVSPHVKIQMNEIQCFKVDGTDHRGVFRDMTLTFSGGEQQVVGSLRQQQDVEVVI